MGYTEKNATVEFRTIALNDGSKGEYFTSISHCSRAKNCRRENYRASDAGPIEIRLDTDHDMGDL